MQINRNYSFTAIKPSHADLLKVIRSSIGFPTEVKIQTVLSKYADSSHYLVGCLIKDQLIGIIGIKKEDHEKTIIRHISVLKTYQNQGIGKALIQEAIKTLHLKSLETETDEDAVEFYRKCNFTITPFEGPHGKRFRCELKVELS